MDTGIYKSSLAFHLSSPRDTTQMGPMRMQPSEYETLYFFLKGQTTVIQNVLDKIPSDPIPEDAESYLLIKAAAIGLISCQYKEMFCQINQTFKTIRTILADNKITNDVKTVAQHLLTTLLSMNRQIIVISFQKAKNEDQTHETNTKDQNYAMNNDNDNSDTMNSGNDNSDTMNNDNDNSDTMNNDNDNSDTMNNDNDNSDTMNSGNDNSDTMNSGNDNSDTMNSGNDNSDTMNNDNDNSDTMNNDNDNNDIQGNSNNNVSDADNNQPDCMDIKNDSNDQQETISQENGIHPNSSLSDQPNPLEFVVCRICDEKVPLELIGKHTTICSKIYDGASYASAINEKLHQISSQLSKNYLKTKWPGQPKDAIARILPAFNVVIIVNAAIAVDINDIDAPDELNSFKSGLVESKSTAFINSEIQQIKSLISKKVRASKTLKVNTDCIKNTLSHISHFTAKQASISDFEFIKKISSGAYARVFLARKKATGDIYAIKVIPKMSLTEKNQVKRILAEKDILLRFSNPHIVSFYYSIIGVHNLYLVMEYLPGGDLYSLLQNLGSLDEDTAKQYVVQIVNALKYLRENGIIHRDIKPDNILISKSGSLKLTDFGLSFLGVFNRTLPVDKQIVESDSYVGTPDYVSPEIVLARPHTFTCDLWSLGVLIYELLSGVPPFHGQTENATNQKVVAGLWDPPKDASLEALDLINKLLNVIPEERIGAKDITEILKHPWFHDVNTDEPPFVPELNSEEDTDYFKCRYKFDKRIDDDIIQDLKSSEKKLDSLEKFESVSVRTLAAQNIKLADIYKSKNSPQLRLPKGRRRPRPQAPSSNSD